MSVTVETLEKLERKVALSLPAQEVQKEIEQRLRTMARTIRIDGFRPGKVPIAVMGQRYGHSVQNEVVSDRINKAFTSVVSDARLRVAGSPRITERADVPAGELGFDVLFEVFPDVVIKDLAGIEIERLSTQVDDSAIERTLDILRKQRRLFSACPPEAQAQDGNRVTVDFEGKIDGEPFAGGKAENFTYVLGEGQMLPEFDAAARGMKSGESKTFQMVFPADYRGHEVAGKTADFLVTVKSIEAGELPQVDDALAKALGVEDGGVEGLRADIRKNLDREVKFRLQARNKQSVVDALLSSADLELPQATVAEEMQRLVESTREDLRNRGMKDADKAAIPPEMFRPQAEQRVRLGLVLAEMVRAHELQAKPEQVRSHIEELASGYEKPDEVVRWYYGDADRLRRVQSAVAENNVTEFVLSQARVIDKTVMFDELMAPAAPATA